MNDVPISIGHMPGASESPLEERFGEVLDTYRAPDLASERQIEIRTRLGLFRLDVLFTSSWGRKVGIELDGRAYHDYATDVLRDAAILATGHLKRIIRIAGRDLYRHPQQVMYLLSQMEPWCVSPRAHAVLKSQMHAAGNTDPAPWVSSYGAGIDVLVEERDEDDRRPALTEYAVLTDHTPENAHIRRALDLMVTRPTWTLAELKSALELK